MADEHDICRVCRCEGTAEKPLFYPCVCTGSIKYVHQECLVQWLKYSKKEFCELCKHKFSFTPIYAPDMPSHLPIYDIIGGLLKSVGKALKYWFHYTLVAIAWLGVVPLTACRICRCLFTGSVSSLLTLPMDMLSTENVLSDAVQGTFIVLCSLCVFISLVWLREQLVHGGIPAWLQDQEAQPAAPVNNNNAPAAAPVGPGIGPGMNGAGDGGEPDIDEIFGGEMELDDTDDDDIDDVDDWVEEEAEEEAVQAPGDPGENNWNPMAWDRAAEELTWERLLGLDGSLIFLEHVFWVVSLNTLFVLVFAFCPYHIGQWTVNGLRLTDIAQKSQFKGVVTTMIGYIVVACVLVVLHSMFYAVNLMRNGRDAWSVLEQRARKLVGLFYIVVKVTILIVGEIGMFPLVCGWWLDLCSLPMFNATLKARTESFQQAPGTAMFVHWLVGMVYVFYFASFILLLREVFRPGVLWFLRNVNDPDFNPINEMIHVNVYRHARRFILSMLIFGSTVMLMLWLPIKLVRLIYPSFLPYHVALSTETPISEISLEILLLQVVLPSLLDQGHTRTWLKGLVTNWTRMVSYLLDLKSYLLGDVVLTEMNEANIVRGEEPVRWGNANMANQQPNGVGEAHQALLNLQGPTGFQPYYKPRFFVLRIVTLLMLTCLSLFAASVISLVLPVWIGRRLMDIWMPGTKVHELYTAACGLYICWLSLRATAVVAQWVPLGLNNLLNKLKEWTVVVLNVAVLTFLLVGVVPLLIGVLFEQIVVMPLRVPLDQSPVFFPWQDWALGVLHTKIICALAMMGPNWWLRHNLEVVYNNGLWNLDLRQLVVDLCIPVILTLGLILAVPYVIANSLAPALGAGLELQNIINRRIYPCGFSLICTVTILAFNFKQFKNLYEHIKNDKYLVGRQLVNYDNARRSKPATVHPSAS